MVSLPQDETDFEMAVFSAVPWFKVVERYPLSGEERQYKRRDLRRGVCFSSSQPIPWVALRRSCLSIFASTLVIPARLTTVGASMADCNWSL